MLSHAVSSQWRFLDLTQYKWLPVVVLTTQSLFGTGKCESRNYSLECFIAISKEVSSWFNFNSRVIKLSHLLDLENISLVGLSENIRITVRTVFFILYLSAGA
jgi:hypothetical protein